DARARFLKAAEADPKDPSAGRALLRAAGMALEARQADEARRLARTFVGRFPASELRADARLIEARAALIGGRSQEAVAVLTASLAEDKPRPDTAQAERYYLALAYKDAGQPAKSTEALDALARGPAAPVAADAQF